MDKLNEVRMHAEATNRLTVELMEMIDAVEFGSRDEMDMPGGECSRPSSPAPQCADDGSGPNPKRRLCRRGDNIAFPLAFKK